MRLNPIPRFIPLALLIVALGVLAFQLANFGICDTVVAQTLPAPDGARKLVVFHRACGATVDFNIRAASHRPTNLYGQR